MSNRWKVVLCILLETAAVSCISFCPSMPSEILRNMVVADNTVIVGSSSTLYRLTPDLVEVETVMLDSPNRLLVADRTRDKIFEAAVLACGSLACRLSPITALSDIDWKGPVLDSGESNVLAALSLTNDGTLSVTYGTRQSPNRPTTITRGSLLNSFRSPPYTFSEYAEQREPNTSVMREFLAVFSHQNYQYFVVNDNSRVHITRLCLLDNGNQASPFGTFVSHFELELRCANTESATAATFVNSTELFGVETVILAFQEPTSDTFHICAFNLSEINERMDQKFETCIHGSGNVGFQRSGESPCPILQPERIDTMNVSTCNLTESLLPGLQVDIGLDEPLPLLSLEFPGASTSVAYTEHLIDGSHYLFLGTGSGRLLQIDIENSTHAEVVRDLPVLDGAITQLVTSDGGDYIYALTARQLLRQPVDPDEIIALETCEPPSAESSPSLPQSSPSPPPQHQSPPPHSSQSLPPPQIQRQSPPPRLFRPPRSPRTRPSPLPTPRPPPSPTPSPRNPPQTQPPLSPTPLPRPPRTSSNVVVIASSVSAGVFVILHIILIAVIALVVTYKKSKQKVTNVSEVLREIEEDPLSERRQIQDKAYEGMRVELESVEELSQDLVIPNSQIRLLESIGQGEFGIVYKAHLIQLQGPPKAVAVKTLKGLFTVDDVHNMTTEIMMMKNFDHPNVMTLVGVSVSVGAGPAIVMPFMANGSLLNYLRRDKKNITIKDDQDLETLGAVQKLLLNLCLQVAKGMEYLALQKFVHRDLAARNCMIDSGGVIKVADFGLAEDMYNYEYFRQGKSGRSVKLPFKWMPLESLQEGMFSQKSDVWSFGITCWEVFTAGEIPYAGVDPLMLAELLESGKRLKKPSNAACSKEIYTVMRNCWKSKPDNRPQFSELVSIISDILESVAGYLELAMSLQNVKSNFGGGETRSDESGPGSDDTDFVH